MTFRRFSTVAARSLAVFLLLAVLINACSSVTNLGRGPLQIDTPAPPLLPGSPTGLVPPTGPGDSPLRLALYYDGYPEAWAQDKSHPVTNYQPSLGYYDSSDPAVIQKHIQAMQYGLISAGLVSWAGQNTPSDQRFPGLLEAAHGSPFQWAIYEETADRPSISLDQAQADLIYIRDHYSADPNYLHIDGRFAVFVNNPNSMGCDASDLWKAANPTLHAYLVLKVVTGFRDCANQPDGWYQAAPANSDSAQGTFSYTISPGFWKPGQSPRLSRDLKQWDDSVRKMVASNARFQLITSFNDWISGTAVEDSPQWDTPSGYGAYLDALHTSGSSPSPDLGNLDATAAAATPGPAAGSGATPPSASPTPPSPSSIQITPAPPGTTGAQVILAVGDISSCSNPGDYATAKIIERFPDAPVLTLGDTAYEDGTLAQFQDCFNPAWGSFKDRIHPAVGNHEYLTPHASGYFTYFGAAAGNIDQGWYSYDLGSWHIITLNSNCSKVGGCGPNSPQAAWLRADLAAHPTQCTLAYWHHPLFSSGEHGNQTFVRPLWNILYQGGVDLVLNGHDHDYERFIPVDPGGNPDPQNGITEFVVGTGGKNYYKFGNSIESISATHASEVFGVLELTLNSTSFDWKFIPEAGKTYTDSGSQACH